MEPHIDYLRDAVAVNIHVHVPDLENQLHVEPESDSDDLPTVPLIPNVPQFLVKDPSKNPPPWRYPIRIRNPPDSYK